MGSWVSPPPPSGPSPAPPRMPLSRQVWCLIISEKGEEKREVKFSAEGV